MKNKVVHIVYLSIIALLVSIFYLGIDRNVRTIEVHKTDTIFKEIIDTIEITKLQPVKEVILDTIYFEVDGNDEIERYIVQQHFHQDNLYDAWISGMQPLKMDSIKVYNKTEYKTITNETIKEVYPKTTDLYFTIEGLNINNQFSPNIGLSVKFKKDFILGAKLGYYSNAVYYGINLGFKLNNRKR